MAGKISELGAQTGAVLASTDKIETLDVSDVTMAATGTNKSLTVAELLAYLNTNLVVVSTSAPIGAPARDGMLWVVVP